MRASAVGVLLIGIGMLAVGGCQHAGAPNVLLGTLEWDRVELIAEASEPILDIGVREGDRVVAGQTVLRLDPRRADNEIAVANAEIARLTAVLDEQQHGPRPENISEAKARLARTVSLELNAEQDLGRAQQMRERQLIPKSDLDRATAQAHAARAEREAAAAALAALLAGTRSEEIAATAAALAGASAHLAAAQLNRERLDIKAPRSGRIDALPVRVGDQPARGATLMVLLAGDAPYARVYVPAPQRAAMSEGMILSVEVEGIAEPFKGRLRHIEAEASFTPYYALSGDDASRLTYRAQVDLEGEAARKLPAGLPARARIAAVAP